MTYCSLFTAFPHLANVQPERLAHRHQKRSFHRHPDFDTPASIRDGKSMTLNPLSIILHNNLSQKCRRAFFCSLTNHHLPHIAYEIPAYKEFSRLYFFCSNFLQELEPSRPEIDSAARHRVTAPAKYLSNHGYCPSGNQRHP
ncbi:hypothetical protein D3C75_800820 [compost metagenome]